MDFKASISSQNKNERKKGKAHISDHKDNVRDISSRFIPRHLLGFECIFIVRASDNNLRPSYRGMLCVFLKSCQVIMFFNDIHFNFNLETVLQHLFGLKAKNSPVGFCWHQEALISTRKGKKKRKEKLILLIIMIT